MKKVQECFECEYYAEEYDVIVAGGGIAGISAALAASRNGAKKVLLLEKQYALGGLATLGLITYYLPLCDGKGTQVSFGIAEELLLLSMKYGAQAMYPDSWMKEGKVEKRKKQRFQVQYNANMFSLLVEQILIDEGIEILYGTSVCDVLKEGNKISALIIENKSGRNAVSGNAYIDATGDADVCYMAGEATALFQQGNILAGWYYYIKDGKHRLKALGAADIPDRDKTEKDFEAEKDRKRYGGIDAWEVSKMVQESHDSLLNDFIKKKEKDTDELTDIPSIPLVRMTRRLVGITEPDDDVNAVYEDSIGVVGDWRKSGPSYEIPFSSLYGGNVKNLLAVGRCSSATEAMWDVTRVIPVCAVTGEAAGTAAAIWSDFDSVSIKQLQEQLRKNGVKPTKEEIYS